MRPVTPTGSLGAYTCSQIQFSLSFESLRQRKPAKGLPAGSSVGAAIRACGILSAVPELAGQQLDVGVFGRSCGLEAAVRDGDRIEIYRPLTVDPKAARRQRAALKGR